MTWKSKTIAGHPVRIYAEDGCLPYPIHGAVWDDAGMGHANLDGWHPMAWDEAGKPKESADYYQLQKHVE